MSTISIIVADTNIYMKKEMSDILVWFLLIKTVYGGFCGTPCGCQCSVPILNTISCTNISVFPVFDELIQPGVLRIVINDTYISDIQPFEKVDWLNLHELVFRRNKNLNCNIINSLQRDGLHINSDCITSTEHTYILPIVCSISVLFTIGIFGAMFVKRRCNKRRVAQGPVDISTSLNIDMMSCKWCKRETDVTCHVDTQSPTVK